MSTSTTAVSLSVGGDIGCFFNANGSTTEPAAVSSLFQENHTFSVNGSLAGGVKGGGHSLRVEILAGPNAIPQHPLGLNEPKRPFDYRISTEINVWGPFYLGFGRETSNMGFSGEGSLKTPPFGVVPFAEMRARASLRGDLGEVMIGWAPGPDLFHDPEHNSNLFISYGKLNLLDGIFTVYGNYQAGTGFLGNKGWRHLTDIGIDLQSKTVILRGYFVYGQEKFIADDIQDTKVWRGANFALEYHPTDSPLYLFGTITHLQDPDGAKSGKQDFEVTGFIGGAHLTISDFLSARLYMTHMASDIPLFGPESISPLSTRFGLVILGNYDLTGLLLSSLKNN